ncbi:T9SS C-terminal target domain-containing protein [candidate division KSB1 bacterium]|nr:S8 family serine peptidase [candidate division KSB1 bacterium]RQW01066.1 MAG: T9SS C-terminal target domain-containing protein [candidate division KSB1 bacterium]
MTRNGMGANGIAGILRVALLAIIFIFILMPSSTSNDIRCPAHLSHKLGSGYLERDINSKMRSIEQRSGQRAACAEMQRVLIYTDQPLSTAQTNTLAKMGVRLHREQWTPPVAQHPLGYHMAEIHPEQWIALLSLDFVKKVDTAELIYAPQGNSAVHVIEANVLWARGYNGAADGSSVKVAILDAGLDVDHPDLPPILAQKDYSSYPTLDDDIRTFATGHGSHVTGLALGRGLMSQGNTGNSGGAYSGVAPGADLIFLKIGDDEDGTARSNVIYTALEDAVTLYDADVINLSYGSWDAYHDGSGFLDQHIDYIVQNYDVPVIVAAGNYGGSKRHYSETVPAFSESDYIQVNVANAQSNTHLLKFNLVWFDGTDVHNNITLNYYDANRNILTDVRYFSQAESPHGTEHRVSYYNPYLPAGNSTYFVKIVNNSDQDQLVHIYEDDNEGRVTFEQPDSRYTITSPSTASHAFTVGACGNRSEWTDYLGQIHSSYTSDTHCSFSGNGPRVDELEKPHINAPGRDLISIRDRNVYSTPSSAWIDNDGLNYGDAGDADYVIMSGTSMATPVVTGAAALILDEHPDYSADQVYNALVQFADILDGIDIPDVSWGYGVLDLDEDDSEGDPIAVDVTAFMAYAAGDSVIIEWHTTNETHHAGYNVWRRDVSADSFVKINLSLISTAHELKASGSIYKFIDKVTRPVEYKLQAVSLDGSSFFYGPIMVTFESQIKATPMPSSISLQQNYPNPFNPSTTISFTLPSPSEMTLIVFDMHGTRIKTLMHGRQSAGSHAITWDGSDQNGASVASGIYVVRLKAGDFVRTRRMTLVR